MFSTSFCLAGGSLWYMFSLVSWCSSQFLASPTVRIGLNKYHYILMPLSGSQKCHFLVSGNLCWRLSCYFLWPFGKSIEKVVFLFISKWYLYVCVLLFFLSVIRQLYAHSLFEHVFICLLHEIQVNAALITSLFMDSLWFGRILNQMLLFSGQCVCASVQCEDPPGWFHSRPRGRQKAFLSSPAAHTCGGDHRRAHRKSTGRALLGEK